MLPKLISDTTPLPALEPTHKIPVAAEGSSTAFHITGQALLESIPVASAAERGTLFLATQAETRAGLLADHAVTPASLVAAVGPRQLAPGWSSLGRLNSSTFTAAQINSMFSNQYGRSPAQGDLITLVDDLDRLFFLVFNAALTRWEGADLTTKVFTWII